MMLWIHTTWASISNGGDTTITAGDEPSRPTSIVPDPKACTTSAPEENWLQSISALGMHSSSHPSSRTMRSPLGIGWKAICAVAETDSSTSTGQPVSSSGASSCSASWAVVQALNTKSAAAAVARVGANRRPPDRREELVMSLCLSLPRNENASQVLQSCIQCRCTQPDDDNARYRQGCL